MAINTTDATSRKELLTLLKPLGSFLVFNEVRDNQPVVFCVEVCWPLFVFPSYFLGQLSCLPFFYIRLYYHLGIFKLSWNTANVGIKHQSINQSINQLNFYIGVCIYCPALSSFIFYISYIWMAVLFEWFANKRYAESLNRSPRIYDLKLFLILL
jgi:hypothetical protein